MINIKVVNKNKHLPLPLHPKNIDPFETQLYEIWNGEELDSSYLFTDGGQVMYFYEDGGKYYLGYQTKKDLKEWCSNVRIVPVRGKISVTIEIE